MARKEKYTKDRLQQAANQSKSLRQLLSKLSLKEAGGNYANIKEKLRKFEVDISHFRGKGWGKDRQLSRPSRPLTEVLVYGRTENTYKLKRRLLKVGLKAHECEQCHLTHWCGNPIPLELHHIDGDNKNNRLENLQLLCPNCHALTENYRGKNMKCNTTGVVKTERP